jgi:hypothetical protein
MEPMKSFAAHGNFDSSGLCFFRLSPSDESLLFPSDPSESDGGVP